MRAKFFIFAGLLSLAAMFALAVADSPPLKPAYADEDSDTPQPPPEKRDATPEQIKNLVVKLGDPEFQVREDAQKELLEIGEPVLPYLTEALSSDNPETARRAKLLIEKIKPSGPSQAPDRDRLRDRDQRLLETPELLELLKKLQEEGLDGRFAEFLAAFAELLRITEDQFERFSPFDPFDPFDPFGEDNNSPNEDGEKLRIPVPPGERNHIRISSSKGLPDGTRIEITREVAGENEHVTVTISPRDGRPETYEAGNPEDFLNRYPDIAEKYGITKNDFGQVSMRFERRTLPPRPDTRGGDIVRIKPEKNKAIDLGVKASPLDSVLRAHFDLGEKEGVILDEVKSASRAAKIGFAPYDIVLTVNGEKVTSAGNFEKLLYGAVKKGEVTADIYRRGKATKVDWVKPSEDNKE